MENMTRCACEDDDIQNALPLHVLRRVVRYGEESRVEFGF
jgi:hypothetical protein